MLKFNTSRQQAIICWSYLQSYFDILLLILLLPQNASVSMGVSTIIVCQCMVLTEMNEKKSRNAEAIYNFNFNDMPAINNRIKQQNKKKGKKKNCN